MKRCIIKLFGVALLLNAYQALSEEGDWLVVCNGTDEAIRYAYGDEAYGSGWTSVGWIQIRPRDCAKPISWHSNKYFYAETLDSEKRWRSQDRRTFCIDPNNDFTFSEPYCRRLEREFGRLPLFDGLKKLNLS